MGACNFSIQEKSLTVGIVPTDDEELEQEGVDVEQIKTQFSNLWDTVQFLLIDFAKRAGLGITTGGYRGGVQFDHVDQVWNDYKLDADPEMLKDWEE